jgi:hypothetical protein
MISGSFGASVGNRLERLTLHGHVIGRAEKIMDTGELEVWFLAKMKLHGSSKKMGMRTNAVWCFARLTPTREDYLEFTFGPSTQVLLRSGLN